jgi:hypothetical protein
MSADPEPLAESTAAWSCRGRALQAAEGPGCYPTQAKRRLDPGISYCAAPAMAACAAFFKESRMRFVAPPSLRGNPGEWATRRFVQEKVPL